MPDRIQRRRAKGWRLPENAVCVDRSTPWGNPFIVGRDGTAEDCVRLYTILLGGHVAISAKAPVAEQLKAFRYAQANYRSLRGKDLACWCREGQVCHGDVLLYAANHEGAGDA